MCSLCGLSTPILVQNTTLGGKVPLAMGKRPSPALEDNMPSVSEELDSIFPAPSLKCYAEPWEVNSIYTWKSKTHRDKISLIYLEFRRRENKACLFVLLNSPGTQDVTWSCSWAAAGAGRHTLGPLTPAPGRGGNRKAAQKPFQKDVQCDPSNEM